ncbi:aspartate/glutamate racemase family protein [Ramlibacter alkalitolerans]|uniref:Aspartate/glutamate racemase family protein n=2 Tax=Ramlibacter alkalitolerans TaxID=2039631 RepID=A0ABS1JR81_9BURK|nr:aspartate/glutamate racemase family protein [Ramlibacter alkalitolerans]MBL0426656.1 aspartate/glutamate racemase family protein [Ramlibacter alkalitolerans]
MRKIGLIGGMSFEASAIYYRLINEAVRQRLGGLHSAEVLLHSVDFQPIVELQQASDWARAGERLADVARGLARAGADCLLICANTMHLVADAVAAAVDLPLIHIIDETAARLKAAGRQRPLLIATRYTMEHGFYGERMQRHGIELMVPDAQGRTVTHDIIFDELCAGKVVDASREALLALIAQATSQGADSVILGCTELCLILDPARLPVPGFDSTAIHAEAAVEFALGAREGGTQAR